MARHFAYASHAQVLSDHPLFSWEAVVDHSKKALRFAREKWAVPLCVGSVEELLMHFHPEVAVIATPPKGRVETMKTLKGVRGVMVEKPLGVTLRESVECVEFCRLKNIAMQVNYWRRGDELFQELAATRLSSFLGRPVAAFGLYGNGLMNNGSHMIDFVRMLLGDVKSAGVLSPQRAFEEGPIPGDKNFAFSLEMEQGAQVVFQPIQFGSYREVGIDIWGGEGRLSILQESLGIYLYPRERNRAISGEWEIASDRPKVIPATCGRALYRLYDNLADALLNGTPLWSAGEQALNSEKTVYDLLKKAGRD